MFKTTFVGKNGRKMDSACEEIFMLNTEIGQGFPQALGAALAYLLAERR